MKEDFLYVIFLELHKANGSLEKDRQLEILERYRVGPLYCHILREYWDRLMMVARTGG